MSQSQSQSQWLGFLNLDKPAGLTSHDCVARVRRLLKLKRVGHGGTLDPAATGVLPIALGSATRLLQFLPEDKAYEATIRLGLTTSTDDLVGDVLTTQPIAEADQPDLRDRLRATLPQFIGTIDQVPPAYSAIHVNGERAYDLARSGQAVALPSRSVQVMAIDVLAWRGGEFPEVDLAIACGPGTYIRSIARDLGQILGTGATLAVLRRTASCGLSLADSLSLEALAEQVEQNQFQPIAPALALTHFPAVTLTGDRHERWYFGQTIALTESETATLAAHAIGPELLARAIDDTGHLIGIGTILFNADTSAIVPRVVLPH